MNFNVGNVSSIYHSLFHITSIYIVDRFSKYCFYNHIGCVIVFISISQSFLAKYICVNLKRFFERLKYKGSSMAIQTTCGCQLGEPIWRRNCCSGFVLRYLCMCLTYNIKKETHAKVIVVQGWQKCTTATANPVRYYETYLSNCLLISK